MSTLKLKGSSSGYVELTAPATAGNNTITLPTTAGTVAVKDASNNVEVGTGVTIGSPSSNTFTISTNGSERLRVDSSGNINVDSGGVYYDAVNNRLAVGTTTVNTTLEVLNSSTPIIRVGDGIRHTELRGGSTGQNAAVGTNYAGAFEIIQNGNAAVTIDVSKRLLVGTSAAFDANTVIQAKAIASVSPGILDLQANFTSNIAGQSIGAIRFLSGDNAYRASIFCLSDGDSSSSSDAPGRLVFSTTADGASSPTERMRIQNDGHVVIGKAGQTISYQNPGISLLSNGSADFTRASAYLIAVNRKTDDGVLVEFYQDNNLEGTISVSGTTVSYNGAHLSRWSQLPTGAERTEILRGTVLSNIDEMCEWGDEDNEQLNRMKVSDVEGDKNVSGVFQSWDDDDDTYTNDFYCAMTGDFIIRIGAGVTVERGDLLMSAGDGTAKPQGDGFIQDKTIAKVTSTNVSCTYDDGSYCVPCVLMAC